jgi:hypothetical protein
MWRPLTLFCVCLGISSSLRAEQTFPVVQTARRDGLRLFAPVSVNRSKLKFWLSTPVPLGRTAASLDFEHEYGGILGYDFLARYHAIIDLGNRALYSKIVRK